MPTEVAEGLLEMEGAVITRVTASDGVTRLVAVSEKATFSLVIEGCGWDDERCERCSCDKTKMSVRVERV